MEISRKTLVEKICRKLNQFSDVRLKYNSFIHIGDSLLDTLLSFIEAPLKVKEIKIKKPPKEKTGGVGIRKYKRELMNYIEQWETPLESIHVYQTSFRILESLADYLESSCKSNKIENHEKEDRYGDNNPYLKEKEQNKKERAISLQISKLKVIKELEKIKQGADSTPLFIKRLKEMQNAFGEDSRAKEIITRYLNGPKEFRDYDLLGEVVKNCFIIE